MAAAVLAKQHFNNRNPEVVPQLSQEVYQKCSVSLPTESWFVDGQYDSRASLEAFLQADDDESSLPVCAVVGPDLTRAVEAVSTLAESKGVPLVTMSVNERLSDRGNYPSIARSVSDLHFFARSIAYYLQRTGLEREVVGM
jgi:hypothetical protein